ncbi:hypothetical protein GL50803_006927 [Giardia duodenalis]|uniref:Uncharacterized protein n=1 Tax=Giardia intestinalis (strain ATCC 50803 / WB clone C6) TaxID=184922 RepID=D3KG26_GIAIC|nr:hypothetical protein GL50803_006927 [Giardia intestinalis]KAE8303118.1 hypothetical protein GL50803_006927 [Giardia intestinalis]
MNYLLFPVYVDSKIHFPPKSLNYAALLSISLDDKELTSSQVFQRLQKIFIHYVRLESLDLSHGYIRSSPLSSAKALAVSRLRLANLRFDSLECLGQLLSHLNEPRKGLRNLWLKNITIDTQASTLQSIQKVISLTHLSCDSAIPEIFRLLHSRLYWLEVTVNSRLLQSFYASPAQVSSNRYPFLFTPEVTHGFSLPPTVHVLLEDNSNFKNLYMVPKYIVYMYFCLLLIAKSLGGNKLVNISHRRARAFFSRITKCFEEDQIRLDRTDAKSTPSSREGLIYSPSLALSLLSFNLIMRKLISYLEQSGTPSVETHQITIELDALKEKELVVLLPNFNHLLKFLRITPSAKDSNLYKRRYSKKRLHTVPSGLIKLTFILPPTSRAIILSYNKKKTGAISVIETPLVLCLPYDALMNSRFFEGMFDEARENHDCLMLHEHLAELYTLVRRTYFDSTMSSFSSTSTNLIPQLVKSEISASSVARNKEAHNTISSTDSDTPFTNYRRFLCMRDCQICSAARDAAKDTDDPDCFIQSIFATKSSPFYCDKVAARLIRKLIKIQIRASPEFNSSATDITFTHASAPRNPAALLENNHAELAPGRGSSTEYSSVSFIQTASYSEEEESNLYPSPRRSIDKLMKRTMGTLESFSENCTDADYTRLPGLFEHNRIFRYIDEYVDNANTFLVYNGYILSISYEVLRKVYLLDLKRSALRKHPVLRELSPPNVSAAITSYVAYEDVHSICQRTIQAMVKAYLTGGYYARSMDRLLIKGTADMGTTGSKGSLSEPFLKITASDVSKTVPDPGDCNCRNKANTSSHQLLPFIDVTVDWGASLIMGLNDSQLSKESKFIRCVHNLLRSHASPMINSQLRAVAPVIYSKEYRRFYIHPAPGVIPNTQQLYGIGLLAKLHKDEFGECMKGSTSICIISLHFSAYDLIHMLQGGLLSCVSPAIRKINIETITIVYSTKLEILLLFYLLIGQPALTIIINKLSFKYAPAYRQDHLNSMLTDILSSSLEWRPQASSKNSAELGKKTSTSASGDRFFDHVVRRFHGNSRPEDSELNKGGRSGRVGADAVDGGTENSYSLDCSTYTSDSITEVDSTLDGFIVDSDETTDEADDPRTPPQKHGRDESTDSTDEDPVVVGFSRKAQELTSKRLDLVVYKDLIDDITQKTGIPVNTLQYTDLTLKIIRNLNSMKLQVRVRLCVLTSFINDNEELGSTRAQATAEQEYASHVVFLTKILKCMIKADINAFIFENVALDWSLKFSNIKNELIDRITGLRDSLARGIGVFYIIGSTIQEEKP